MSRPNRRRHDRVRARGIAAHLQTEAGLAFCMVENISEGGLFVRTQQLLPLGTAVSLSLARPGFKRALKIEGQVVNVLEPAAAAQLRVQPGMGLQFSKLRAEEAQRLQELIRELGMAEPLKVTGREPTPEPRSLARSLDQAARPTEVGMDAPTAPSAPPAPAPPTAYARPAAPAASPASPARPPAAGAGPGPGAAAGRNIPIPNRPVREVVHNADPRASERRIATPVAAPGPSPAVDGAALPSPDSARLIVQIRETRSALSVLQAKLNQKEEQVDKLHAEVERLREELRQRDALLEKLGHKSGR